MTSIARTAYPQFERFLSARELHVYYTPQPEKIAWASGQGPDRPPRHNNPSPSGPATAYGWMIPRSTPATLAGSGP
ncbi:hypothetical protein Nm8I071_22870 [Nonomuraea sp. TT08I-71]|nr:hypothetical protein Nm8I071_22870 [Nonomuraea sp. TT08I-71]